MHSLDVDAQCVACARSQGGVVQWVGGYPFEVAAPDVVFDFCDRRGS